jgi:hypothetical protein
MHPRDRNGRFIEIGGLVNVTGDDGTARRGTVTKITKMGPQVQYADDNSFEIIPTDDTNRVTVAPKATARLPVRNAAPDTRPAKPAARSMGNSDTTITNIEDMSDGALRNKINAETDPEERALLQAEEDRRDAVGKLPVGDPGRAALDREASLRDRGFARQNGLPVPTAKEAKAAKDARDKQTLDAAWAKAQAKKATPAKPVQMSQADIEEKAATKFGYNSQKYKALINDLDDAGNKFGIMSPQYQKLLQVIAGVGT